MSADTIVRPSSPIGPTDEDEIHLWCCDPDRALCGANITDEIEIDEDVPDDRLCVLCVVMDDSSIGCGAKGCSG